jgi:hypothetical protein
MPRSVNMPSGEASLPLELPLPEDDPLLPLPPLLLLEEESELPLPERVLSSNGPSVDASATAAETLAALPPQPHRASPAKERTAPWIANAR